MNLGNDSSILWCNKNPFLLPIIAGAQSVVIRDNLFTGKSVAEIKLLSA
jgi:hypothetical protein